MACITNLSESKDIIMSPTFNNLWEIIQYNPTNLYTSIEENSNNNIDNLSSTLFEINIYGHELQNDIKEENIEKNTIQGLQRPYPKWFNEKNCCTGLINQNFHCTQDNINLHNKSLQIPENIYPLLKSVPPPAGPHQNEFYPKQYDFIDRTTLGSIWGKIKTDVKDIFKVNINDHESAHSAFAKYITSKICIYAPPFSGKTSVVTDLRNHGIPATETDIAPTFNKTYFDVILFTNNPKYLRNSEIKIALIPTFYEFSRRLGRRNLKNDKNVYLQVIKTIPKNTKIIFSNDYLGQLMYLTKCGQRAKLIIKNDTKIIGKNWYFSNDIEIKYYEMLNE